ncbi:hypothetical protein B0H11DRAFT_2248307 [Mycena galericulata]|nr:hypothetical protein B0H11DRAFT_2248307 [Mycena galericulata]
MRAPLPLRRHMLPTGAIQPRSHPDVDVDTPHRLESRPLRSRLVAYSTAYIVSTLPAGAAPLPSICPPVGCMPRCGRDAPVAVSADAASVHPPPLDRSSQNYLRLRLFSAGIPLSTCWGQNEDVLLLPRTYSRGEK